MATSRMFDMRAHVRVATPVNAQFGLAMLLSMPVDIILLLIYKPRYDKGVGAATKPLEVLMAGDFQREAMFSLAYALFDRMLLSPVWLLAYSSGSWG